MDKVRESHSSLLDHGNMLHVMLIMIVSFRTS